MSVEGAGCFPNVRRPRTLWVGVGKGLDEVCAVHDAIERAAARYGQLSPGDQSVHAARDAGPREERRRQ